MDSLETLVREAFVEHAADAPSDEGLLGAVTERRRRPPGWFAAAVAAVLVLGIAVSVVLLRGNGSATRPAHPSIPSVPSGMRAISYHGITVDVPATLPTSYNVCLVPTNEVLVVAGAPTCPQTDRPARRPGLVVTVGPRMSTPGGPPNTKRVPNALARNPIRRSTDSAELTGSVNAPRANASVEVTAPTRGQIRRILNTVRLTPVSPDGCASRTPPLPGSHEVPLDPISVAVCAYSVDSGPFDGLIASTSLDQRNAALVAANVRHWIGCCSVPKDWQTYRVTFSYADGSTRTVAVPATAIRASVRNRANLPAQ